MARKNQNAGPRPECRGGAGAQAAFAYFPPPLGRPKYTRRGKEVV